MRTLIMDHRLMRRVRRWARKFKYFQVEGSVTDAILLEDDSGYILGEMS